MDVWSDGISPHIVTQYRNQMSNISVNLVNSNKNILSSLDIRYIGYFYHVFPLHPNTFLELFYAHTLPAIEKVVLEIHFFTSNISGIMNNQIKSLCQFQSIISEFQSDIDSYIPSLSSNIDHLLKFNSIVTKCVKSYLCKYITSIWKHYCSSYNSIKEKVKTFECIQKCLKSMLSQVKGSRPSERYLKRVFSNVLDSKASNTISWINANLPSQKIKLINIYLTMIDKFLDESNDIGKTTVELGNVKNYLSQFTGHITTYTNRMQWYLITPLSRLMRIDSIISKINKNGNGIKGKYDNIKPKIEYCKSYLQFENQRLESISKNAKMLQKQLEILIDMLNKYKTIEDKLKEFIKKLNRMKQNKKKSMDHISRTVQMVICNLYDIRHISTSLNSAKDKVSITTIKQDVENINSSIKDINNILSIVKSHLDSLVGVKLGIDCKLVNDVESCIKEIVSEIHSKYCSLRSELTTIFTGEPSSLSILGGGCQLSGISECECTPQTTDQACGSCQDTQGCQDCQLCESLKQLSTSPSQPIIQQKLNSINKVICRLIDDRPKNGCNPSQSTQDQCPHVCQNNQRGQATSACQPTQQQGSTANTCQQTTNIGELIKCTLDEINQCQTSPALTCESREGLKCENTPPNSCRITGGTQPPSSCLTTTTQGAVSCKDLDKVKLCVDTIVNKCSCPQLKESLKTENLKTCFDVFKCIFIYNFRELFCLYTGFDKSILNEISCLREKLQQMKFDLGGMLSINNNINCRIDCIKNEINEFIKKVESLVNIMRSGINRSMIDMECAIEGLAKNFIGCTLQSLEKHVITCNDHDFRVNEFYGMYSLSRVMDYKVVINRLLESAKKINQILQLNINIYKCKCIYEFQWTTGNSIDLGGINIHSIIDNLASMSKDELSKFLKINEIKKLHELGIDPNHSCLCMVTKYILYPQIVKLFYLVEVDLDMLSTISRKHDEHHNWTNFNQNVPQVLLLAIDILEPISNWIRNKYYYSMTAHRGGVEIKCFCCYHQDSKYHLILNTILVLSSLMENIWTMDTETMRMSIESLSILYSQLEIYDLNSTRLKDVCCNPVYSLLVDRECKPDAASKKCCCCWCSTAVNVLMVCISLCIQCKLCNALCAKQQNGCKKVENFCKVEECTCKCSDPKNGVCCLLQLALSSALPCDEELKKKLEKCCTTCRTENGCCKTLQEKVKTGLCKVLLLGCGCTCATQGPSEQVKVKCVFFNNLDGSPRVAVVVFCKCADPLTKCCCLTALINNFETKLKDKFCKDEECCCKELEKGCEELCCPEDCASTCAEGCPCKELPKKLQKICGNGTTTNCGGGDCLCQLIKKCFEDLCKKENCKCHKSENGCCKCVCCKIVAHSIKILTRACKQNVLEPYKRIVTDLIGSDKNRPEIIRRIINTINQGTVDRISSLKNSYSSYPDSNIGLKDISSVRNWGYDTHHEHQPTDNRICKSDGYPNPLNTLNSNENTLRKLHHFSSLLSSSVDRNFSLVSSSCLEISS